MYLACLSQISAPLNEAPRPLQRPSPSRLGSPLLIRPKEPKSKIIPPMAEKGENPPTHCTEGDLWSAVYSKTTSRCYLQLFRVCVHPSMASVLIAPSDPGAHAGSVVCQSPDVMYSLFQSANGTLSSFKLAGPSVTLHKLRTSACDGGRQIPRRVPQSPIPLGHHSSVFSQHLYAYNGFIRNVAASCFPLSLRIRTSVRERRESIRFGKCRAYRVFVLSSVPTY